MKGSAGAEGEAVETGPDFLAPFTDTPSFQRQTRISFLAGWRLHATHWNRFVYTAAAAES